MLTALILTHPKTYQDTTMEIAARMKNEELEASKCYRSFVKGEGYRGRRGGSDGQGGKRRCLQAC